MNSARGFTPPALLEANRDEGVERWFNGELQRRVAQIGPGLSSMVPKDVQAALEMANRLPDGSVSLMTSPSDFLQMANFISGPQDIIRRAREGFDLLAGNSTNNTLMAIARGVPGGGSSTRAQTWLAEHPEAARELGIDGSTPRSFYPLEGRTLVQVLLENGRGLEKHLDRVIPNIIMTNSEIVPALLESVRENWKCWSIDALTNTFFFNQVVLPRKYVSDLADVEENGRVKLYAAGHGDFPFLLGQYSFVKALHDEGIRYFLFSNADEYMWGPDPVMVSIAEELAQKGNPMLAIGVENSNNQLGGGFVKEGVLVETPRLPWSLLQSGKAPAALNAAFYLLHVPTMLERLEKLIQEPPRILTVKTVPGRGEGTEELIVGVDSHAGDIFTEAMKPSAFIWWPRTNFLGIKDAGFLVGGTPIDYLGGRTYRQFTTEAAHKYPKILEALYHGDESAARQLAANGYCYVDVDF